MSIPIELKRYKWLLLLGIMLGVGTTWFCVHYGLQIVHATTTFSLPGA